MFLKKLYHLGDKLEDRIRGFLGRYPIAYALIAGVAVVLFWRGVWHTADMIPFLTGPVSMAIGFLILLATGVIVSEFIGEKLIITDIKSEKKLVEKVKEGGEQEETSLASVQAALGRIESNLDKLEDEVKDLKH